MEIKYHKRAVKFINSLPMKERQKKLELTRKFLLAYCLEYAKLFLSEKRGCRKCID